MNHKHASFLTAVFGTLCCATALAQAPALHDGDRVAFYGDSITAQRLYTRFVEDFVLTRYPQMQVTFINAGVSGDTVNGGYTGDRGTRLSRDLLPNRPTVVTIMLGMNDGYYLPFDPKYLAAFEDGYRSLVKEIQAHDPEARFTLISTTPYDEVTHGTEFAHYSESVKRNAEFVRDFATSSHFPFAGFHQKLSDLLESGRRINPSLAVLLVPDRIHPSEAAHWAMAAELARAWSISPMVSSVRLDAAKTRTLSVENAEVTDLALKDGSLTWIQTDHALPLPLALSDGMIQFVLTSSELGAMDQQMLRVEGLAAQNYVLNIDERKIGSFSREQLAAGINLALLPTPMENQARGVDGIERERTGLDEAVFNLVIEDPKVDGAAEAARTIRSKDAALALEQRKAAQPKPHRFSLSPVI